MNEEFDDNSVDFDDIVDENNEEEKEEKPIEDNVDIKFDESDVPPEEEDEEDSEDETEQKNEEDEEDNQEEKVIRHEVRTPQKSTSGRVTVNKTGTVNRSLQKGEEFRKTGEEEKIGRKTMARMMGNMEQGEVLNEKLLMTIEQLRLVIESGQNLVSKMDNSRAEMRRTNDSAVQANQQMESLMAQIKEFFQNDYQSLLNDSNRRQMSSYLTQSRDGYMTLFHLAVKNFKQFSESAIKWQKKMETDSGKELKQIYGITKYMPYLLCGMLLLQLATIGYIVMFLNK